MAAGVQRSIDLLLPAFALRVRKLVTAMSARGLDPKVWETLRSPERAAVLAKKGASKNGARSLHCYACAADIVSASALWGDPAFFRALGEEAQSLGLTWGGDWDGNPATRERFVDSPHVQAVPVGMQEKLRALPTDSERNVFIEAVMLRLERDRRAS